LINFFKNLRLSVKLIFKVRIEIIGQKEVNHHMTLLACESLPEGHKLQEDSNSWDFNEFGSCGKGKNIHLYNWALDADGIQFEKGQFSYILLNRNIKKKSFYFQRSRY